MSKFEIEDSVDFQIEKTQLEKALRETKKIGINQRLEYSFSKVTNYCLWPYHRHNWGSCSLVKIWRIIRQKETRWKDVHEAEAQMDILRTNLKRAETELQLKTQKLRQF